MPDGSDPEQFDPTQPPKVDSEHEELDTDRRRSSKRRPLRLSDLLCSLCTDVSHDRLTLSHILDTISVRAFGPLLLIFAIPNMIPAPPGTSAILGLPLIVLTFQMMLGSKPQFPAFIAERSLRREDFASMVTTALPKLVKAERMLRPRLGFLSSRLGERLLGVLCFAMAAIVVLPIPLGNMLPSFAISLIGLGLIERDGYWILAGLGVATAAFALVYGVIWTMAEAGLHFLTNLI